MNKFYVYVYIDPRTDRPFYVGKGFGKRAYAHLSPFNMTHQRTHFANTLRKMAREHVLPRVRLLATGLSEGDAHAYERFFILALGRRDNNTGCLCNHTNGGEGNCGRIASLEERFKKRQNALDMSSETRQKISAFHKGRPKTKEHRQKIGQALKGRKHPPEFGANQSVIKRADLQAIERCRQLAAKQAKPIECVDPVTMIVVSRFESQHAAHRAGFNQGAVSQCIHGHKKHYKGLIWRFADAL
jgi:hypothetical protein